MDLGVLVTISLVSLPTLGLSSHKRRRIEAFHWARQLVSCSLFSRNWIDRVLAGWLPLDSFQFYCLFFGRYSFFAIGCLWALKSVPGIILAKRAEHVVQDKPR
ncbi:hypothetical protein V8F20_007227 [Naviculisporaceae sp. PSN 640]